MMSLRSICPRAWQCFALLALMHASLGAQGSNKAREEGASVVRRTLEAFAKDRDRARAKQGFEEALRIDSRCARAQYNLALLAASEERWDEAIRLLEAARVNDRELAPAADAELAYLRPISASWSTEAGRNAVRYNQALASARVLLDAGRLGEAQARAEEAMRLDNSRYEAFCVAADASFRRGLFPYATKALEHARSVAPQEVRGRLDQALAEVSTRERSDGLLTQGEELLARQSYPEAAEAYAQAWDADPRQETSGLRAALAFLLAERVEDARNLLERLVRSKDAEVRREASLQLAGLKVLEQQMDLVARASAEAEQRKRETDAVRNRLDSALGLYWGGVPEELLAQLRDLLHQQKPIRSIALGAPGAWVVVFERNAFLRSGIPPEMEKALLDYNKQSADVRRVALDAQGNWAVLVGTNGWTVHGPQTLLDALNQMTGKNELLSDIALAGQGWFVLRGDNGWWGEGVPSGMIEGVKELNSDKESLSHVALSQQGGWVFIRGTNGTLRAGCPEGMLAALQGINKAGSTVTSIALGPNESWIVLEKKEK